MGFTYKKLRLNHREHMHMGNTQANASAHTRIHTYLHAPAQFWKLILHTHTRPAPAPRLLWPSPRHKSNTPWAASRLQARREAKQARPAALVSLVGREASCHSSGQSPHI